MSAIRPVLLLSIAALLVLTGCRVAQIEVASALTPTAAPTDGAPPAAVDPSTEREAAAAADDDETLLHIVAAPHLVFAPEAPYVEMFPAYTEAESYLVIESGLALRLRTSWDALWLSDLYGVLQIGMEIQADTPWSDELETWDTLWTDEIEGWGASYRAEQLDSTHPFTEPGEYQIHTHLTVIAHPDDGESQTHESVHRNRVVVFNAPPEPPSSRAEDLIPAFGALESDHGLLLDWRAWAGGPCAVRADDTDIISLMDTACGALEGNDLSTAAAALQEAILRTAEDPPFQARLREQLAVIAAVATEWNIAARHFREALAVWEAVNAPGEAAIAAHNLGAVWIQAGRTNDGEQSLHRASELRWQISDWVGASLTWGQLSLYWQNTEEVRAAAADLASYGLPQADTLYAWADGYDAQDQADSE